MSKTETAKPPKIYTPGGSVDTVWYRSKGVRPTSLDMGRYGLKRLNYATLEPPVWTVPPHPPIKSIAEKVLFPATITVTALIVLWAYMNPEEEDMVEYWKRVESGQILVDDDDEEDDWDDWDDENEEE